MKIASLNIRHGGGTRIAPIIGWLTAQKADAIVLPEWRDNTNGQAIRAALEFAGYSTQGAARSASSNSILLAAKIPFASIRLTPQDAPGGEIFACDLRNGIRIVGCYFPQLEAKRPFFDVCLSQAAQAQTPLLIMGDLNTGRNDIDLDFGAAKFSCADQFVELCRAPGMADLWRKSNGADKKEWTWRSQKNGFRIDHAIANGAFVTAFPGVRCWYDHSPREQKITDHSGLIVDALPDSQTTSHPL